MHERRGFVGVTTLRLETIRDGSLRVGVIILVKALCFCFSASVPREASPNLLVETSFTHHCFFVNPHSKRRKGLVVVPTMISDISKVFSHTLIALTFCLIFSTGADGPLTLAIAVAALRKT